MNYKQNLLAQCKNRKQLTNLIESVKQIPKTPPIPPQRPKSIPTLTTEETETCRPRFNTDAGVLFHLNQRKDINPLDAQLALKTF